MRVYKFLSAEYALFDITEHKVKLSEFSDMNDPFELLAFKWSESEIDELLTEHTIANYGALCFSTNWSNPLLWSHYANKHKGICLGFDVPDGSPVHTPIYVDSREIADPSVLLDALRSRNFWIAESPIMRKLLLKFSGWRYEDEVRMFARLDGKKGEFSYFEFGDSLALREVILGHRCTVSVAEVKGRLKGYLTPVEIVKAQLSPNLFQVVRK